MITSHYAGTGTRGSIGVRCATGSPRFSDRAVRLLAVALVAQLAEQPSVVHMPLQIASHRAAQKSWAILTGEYPPAAGGVGDHTRGLAHALARMGERVCVFTGPSDEGVASPDRCECDVAVRFLPDHFGLASLATLDAAIDCTPRPREILVQYVPHAFGMRAMNLPFCLWLLARSREDRVTVIFHEVAFPVRSGQSFRHNFLGVVNHIMAAIVARAASRAIVTIPAWERMLRKLGTTCPIDVRRFRATCRWPSIRASCATRGDDTWATRMQY